MPITLYAAEIDLSSVKTEEAKERLDSTDAGGSILDVVLEKAASSIANSPRISKELSHCLTRCSDENSALEAGCSGLSHDGFIGYYGSPHSDCTSKAYSIKTDCEFECSRRYK